MIHINIGSNLSSKYGNRFENISIAINLLLDSKIKISRISNYYETPSYPNYNLPKFLNIGALINFNDDCLKLLEIINLIEKKNWKNQNQKK